jgi:hypothetical protein
MVLEDVRYKFLGSVQVYGQCVVSVVGLGGLGTTALCQSKDCRDTLMEECRYC